MIVTVFPNGVIRILPSDNTNYTDSLGNVWTAETGISNAPDDFGCCFSDFRNSFPNITDKQLWYSIVGASNDVVLNFQVPAGTYQITYRVIAVHPAGAEHVKLVAQGQILADNLDWTVAAGGQYLPYTFTSTVSVGTDNKLSFGVYAIDAGAHISSFQIAPQ